MLRIQVHCSLVLLGLFVVSMAGSLTHADLNSAFSLFGLYVVLTHPQYNSIREVVVMMMGVAVLVSLADIWCLVLLGSQPITNGSRVAGYIWICLQLGLKIGLVVLLFLWRNHLKEEDAIRQRKSRYGS